MTTLKIASLLLAAYAVLFTFDSTLVAASNRGGIEWNRFVLFVPVAVLLAWGLWKCKRWAWGGSLAFSFVFGVLQLGSLFVARTFSFSLDFVFLVVTDSTLATALFLLLFPSARTEAWETLS